MPFLRNVVRDLVEKRLWPVAVALLLALIAAPVLLSRTGGEPPEVTPVTPAAPATGSTAQAVEAVISVDPGATERRHSGGDVRDPFKQPKAAKAKAAEKKAAATPVVVAAVPVPAAAPASGSAPAPSPGSTGSTPPVASTPPATTTTPKPATKPRPKPQAPKTYRTSLKFGLPAAQVANADIARLTALPSPENPLLVYLGVLQDGKTAVFIVSSKAVPSGDGTCRPSATACETLEMKAGDTEVLDVTGADGVVTRYQLDVVSVRKGATGGKTEKVSQRHSKAGAALLRDAALRGVDPSAGARSYRYVPKGGVLVRAKRAKRLRSADELVPGASEAARLLPRKEQPGIPVWYWSTKSAGR